MINNAPYATILENLSLVDIFYSSVEGVRTIMEAVLAILSTKGNTALVAWFPNQVALYDWFSRWSARGGGTILEQDLKAAISAIPNDTGRAVHMRLAGNTVAAAEAFVGRACHAHLEFNEQEIELLDGAATITYLIA